MDNFPDDLLVRLINHRVTDDLSRREDYLTECFAWMLENDSKLARWFLGKGGPIYNSDAEKFAPSPRARIHFQTQEQLSKNDRPDISIRSDGYHLIVECKVDAPFDKSQLLRYIAHAQKAPKGSVIAILPRSSIPSHHAWPKNSRFLGIIAWEDIADQVASYPEVDGVHGLFRKWFLRLLEDYNLLSLSGSLDWEDDKGRQNVKEVRKICRMFDSVASIVARDNALENIAPRLYRVNDGALQLTTWTTVSGKGTAPRPILRHSAGLKSRFTPFLDFQAHVYYCSPSHLRRYKEPMMGVSILTKGWCEKSIPSDPEVIKAIIGDISELKSKPSEKLIGKMSDNLVQRTESTLNDFLSIFMSSEFQVQQDVTVEKTWSFDLQITPTRTLFPSGIELKEASERYESWLRQAIHSWFTADPERIFAYLLLDLTLEGS